MNQFQFHKISTLVNKNLKKNSADFKLNHSDYNLKRKKWNPIPIPHRTLPEPIGEDLDFINIAHSHLIHSDWQNLDNICSAFSPFRINHILLKTQKDFVLSLEFFKWVSSKNPSCVSLDSNAIMVHILTKFRKFKSAELILRGLIDSGSGCLEFPNKLFDAIDYSYRICN